LNINHYDALLRPHMEERLQTFCGDYFQSPERFEVRNESELKARYSHLQLRDTSDLRLDNLCQDTGEASLSQTVGTAD